MASVTPKLVIKADRWYLVAGTKRGPSTFRGARIEGARLLCTLGRTVEVLDPQTLRSRLRELAAELGAVYGLD